DRNDFAFQRLLLSKGSARDTERNYHRHRDASESHRASPIGLTRRQPRYVVFFWSALGQKQTCATQQPMSAIPPKADMCGAKRNARFGPIADMVGLACTAKSLAAP